MTSCPACRSSQTRLGPASHATGRRIARCRSCGAQFAAGRAEIGSDIVSATEMSSDDVSDWVDIKRDSGGPEAWRGVTADIRATLAGTDEPSLYDVGAGDGAYLAMARDEYGFAVTGNEILEGAVSLARERFDVELELGDLARLGHQDEFDAATMWCVLAHVPEPDQLLADVFALLKPGGVLFLQTPHRTLVDGLTFQVQRSTGGRVTKIPDRRIAEHHRILHTPRSIAAQLAEHGFVDVAARPQRRYSLTSRAYLASMNPPGWVLTPASWAMDRAISSNLAPRIVLDVIARKPR